ncbi:hypothetical protein ACYSNX_13080, partial [Myroides sp. LJL115]
MLLKSKTPGLELGGRTHIDTKYGFAGNVELVRTTHKRLATSTDVSILENFVYDHQNRLLYQTHKVGTLAEVVIAENIYDELGALQAKRVGGKRSGSATTANTFLQEINYKYNIRGWLTQVNDVNNLDITTNGKRSLFALKLNYNKIEQGITGTTGLYNGNITEQLYRSSLDNKKRGYSYVYDRLNRLTLAALKDPDLTISSNDTPYGEKLTYDKNGNILKLTRNGASVANKVTQIDNLTYSYEAGSNKLSKVVDASGNLEGFKKGNTTTSADYTYDVFGNLTVDRNKNITKISYNSLHLPV